MAEVLSPLAATPLVSVVIPTRNCLPWLPRALASVRAQGAVGDGDAGALEILVVDDGSDDGTDRFLADHAAAEPRLRVLAGPGRGVAAARNCAIAAARGRYLAFLDADDVWRPGRLGPHVAALERHGPEAVMLFADYTHVHEDGRDLGRCFSYWPDFAAVMAARGPSGIAPLSDARRCIFRENVVGTSTVLVRTARLRAIGGFDTGLRVAEDWDAWLKLARAGTLLVDPAIAATYLVRAGSTSRSDPARLEALAAVARQHGADPAIGKRDRRAVAARLADAAAEQSGIMPWRRFGHRLRALICRPDRRRLRQGGAALAAALLPARARRFAGDKRAVSARG